MPAHQTSVVKRHFKYGYTLTRAASPARTAARRNPVTVTRVPR
jgi:hypothetical protein